MTDRYVAPAEGRTVRDPDTRQVLPAAGAWVPDTAFWRRRLADGDVVPAAPPKPQEDKPQED